MKYALITTLSCLLLASCSKDKTTPERDAEYLFGTWQSIGKSTPTGGTVSYREEEKIKTSFEPKNKDYFLHRNNDTFYRAQFIIYVPEPSSEKKYAYEIYGPLVDTDGLPTYYAFRNDSMITYHGDSEFYYKKIAEPTTR